MLSEDIYKTNDVISYPLQTFGIVLILKEEQLDRALMIDISELTMVETICASGSLTKASEAMSVSQPTLSKRLAKLEDQLGARLFHRASNGLKPTLIANFLVEKASPIKSHISSIERQVERILSHDQGDIRIGVDPIIEQVMLPGVLIKMMNYSGNVRFSVFTEGATALVDKLKSGELDVIAGSFGASPCHPEDHDIMSIELTREQTINVARVGHPIFKTRNPKFFEYAYAYPSSKKTPELSRPSGFGGRRLSLDNYTLIKKVALETDYICGGPKEVFISEIEAGTMQVVPDSPSVEWRSSCLIKTEATETPLVGLFIETLLECRDEYLKAH